MLRLPLKRPAALALVLAPALTVVLVRGDAAPLPAGAPPVLLSRQLAARAHLAPGDVVTFALASDGGGARRFRVAGIYEPTPDPMRFTAQRLEARMHLPDLLAIAADPSDPADPEAVSAINVALKKPGDARQFSLDVGTYIPGVAVQPTARPKGVGPFAVLDRFHEAISAVTIVGGTAFLLALMVIRAEERRETIAILRLVGISRRTLLTSVALEGLLVAALGAVFGVLLAYATEGLVNRIFQARYDTTLVFVRITPSIAARAIAVAAPLGIVAGVVASWTLLRRNVLTLFHR